MNVLDLHTIQNFPVSCLNRDENGSPKAMTFGGTARSRISSQCDKRAIREYLKSIDKTHFGGVRMRSIATSLSAALATKGMAQELATALGNAVANLLGTSENEKTKTILFFSDGEINAIAQEIVDANASGNLKKIFKITEDKKAKETKYECLKGSMLKNAQLVDIADIELFGRMVASDPTLFVEGAVSEAHRFSVHAVENDIDFFSAVDETASKEDSGAGHIGEIEFNSACYYGCISINLDLFNNGRLSTLPVEIRKEILAAAIEACIIAVPGARHNSMFSATKPSAVAGIVRKNTFPMSLANAFEKPLRPSPEGYSERARAALASHLESLKKQYGKRFGVVKELWFPDVNLDDFTKGLVDNA
jgi:CRISPR system Cascade subunit CasC